MKKRTIKHKTGYSQTIEIDISKKACHPFGFYYNDRVNTKFGKATVLGVNKNNLWFLWDEDGFARRYQSGFKKEDFIKENVTLI